MGNILLLKNTYGEEILQDLRLYRIIKEILKYCRGIHQLRRWYQDIFGYEFSIIHCIASMMKDVDGLSRYIDPLICRHLVQAYYIPANNNVLRPYDYCRDTFTNCYNSRRITASDTTVVTKLSSLILSLSIVHHSPSTLLPRQFYTHIPLFHLNHPF